MQRTPEKCIVPKFHQNLTNGSKVKSKKLFLAFISNTFELDILYVWEFVWSTDCHLGMHSFWNFDNWITGFRETARSILSVTHSSF